MDFQATKRYNTALKHKVKLSKTTFDGECSLVKRRLTCFFDDEDTSKQQMRGSRKCNATAR